jgi:hypothetical protein
MTRSRRAVALLGLLSVVVAFVAIWLLLHNPTVKSTTLGHYTCSAPYDTVLLDADNVPGGEPPADADEVEARCIDVGKARFTQGLVVGAAAFALAALAAVLAVRGRATTVQEDAPHANPRASG